MLKMMVKENKAKSFGKCFFGDNTNKITLTRRQKNNEQKQNLAVLHQYALY